MSEYNKTETNSQIQRKTSGYQWGERKGAGQGRGSGRELRGRNYYV